MILVDSIQGDSEVRDQPKHWILPEAEHSKNVLLPFFSSVNAMCRSTLGQRAGFPKSQQGTRPPASTDPKS